MSVSVTTPVRVPVAVGLNSTLMVQLDPAATELPQVPNPAKAKSPLMVKLPLKVKVAVPVFETVTNCTELVVPTAELVKVSEVGERLTTGPEVELLPPVPVRLTV